MAYRSSSEEEITQSAFCNATWTCLGRC